MTKLLISFLMIGSLFFASGCSMLNMALSAAAAYGISQAMGD